MRSWCMCGHDRCQEAYHSRRPRCNHPPKHPRHFLILLSRKRQLGRTGAARRVVWKDLDDVRSNGKLAADLAAQRVTTAPSILSKLFGGGLFRQWRVHGKAKPLIEVTSAL